MNRRRRTWIIGKASPQFSRRLADLIRQKYSITIIQPPRQVLVMAKMRETGRNSLFYLGELMVIEARVLINNHLGIGIIQHDDLQTAEQLALDAAIIDAAYVADLEESRAWESLLQAEERRLVAELRADLQRIRESIVNFETMDMPNEE